MSDQELRVHPAAESVRLMRADELASLTEDIRENGLRDVITLGHVNGREFDELVDGRNRLRACEAAEIEPRFEIIEFEDDDAVKRFVKSRNERRDLSKGERAMEIAWLYPSPERGRGKKDEARKEIENISLSYARVKQARQVLRHSLELAIAVRDGVEKLDDALAKVTAEREARESDETKLAQLHAEAPDLADAVREERLTLSETWAAFQQRRQDEAAKEANKRETMLRLSEAAYRGVIAWAADEFVSDIEERLDDEDFCQRLIERLRIDPSNLKDIAKGAKALAHVLGQLKGVTS